MNGTFFQEGVVPFLIELLERARLITWMIKVKHKELRSVASEYSYFK